MNDRLEEFIRQHREEFDDQNPPEKVWENISAGMKQEGLQDKHQAMKTSLSQSWIWKAAAVFFFATTSWFVVEKLLPRTEETAKEVAVSQEYMDFQAADQYYTTLISQKKAEIEAFQLANLNLEDEFLQDVNKLDSMYLELKKELKSFQYNEKLMDAVIRNLQLRVEILNKQIDLLRKIQSIKEQEGTVSI